MARNISGLTLLEVLAATLIFVTVMTVLIGTSTTLVHRAGTASKRLEANLVADVFLADLEIQIKQRLAPVIEEPETNREDFTIQVSRSGLLGSPEDAPSLGLAGFGGAESGTGAREIAGLLAGDLPEVIKHLYQYDIDVSWIDSSGVQNVTRTTFAFDWQAAALEFSDLFGGGGSGDEGEGNDGDEDGEEADVEESIQRLREETGV